MARQKFLAASRVFVQVAEVNPPFRTQSGAFDIVSSTDRSYRLHAPVRFVLNRDEGFRNGRPRTPMIFDAHFAFA